MPGTLTNVGADRMYDGFFSGGVYVSLHTASPPTEANKIQDSWYSDAQVAAGGWTEHNDGDYREVDNDDDIDSRHHACRWGAVGRRGGRALRAAPP